MELLNCWCKHSEKQENIRESPSAPTNCRSMRRWNLLSGLKSGTEFVVKEFIPSNTLTSLSVTFQVQRATTVLPL